MPRRILRGTSRQASANFRRDCAKPLRSEDSQNIQKSTVSRRKASNQTSTLIKATKTNPKVVPKVTVRKNMTKRLKNNPKKMIKN